MKSLLALLFLSSAAAAACNPDDVVTNGATTNALGANGRPLITVEGVGVEIQRRGGRGSFAVHNECDAATASVIRRELAGLLNEEAVTIVPVWLDR